MNHLPILVLAFCSVGAFGAKLDHLQAGNNAARSGVNFFGAGRNTADAQSLFGSLGSYLPPVTEGPKCEAKTITRYETVTLPATTAIRPAPSPRTQYVTETSYVTQRPQTIVNTITNYRTSTVNQYNTVTRTSLSTVVSTQVRPTTIISTRVNTMTRTMTNVRTQYETQYSTVVSKVTLPPQTNYITNTITLPPRVTTLTSTRLSTRVEYSTVVSTRVTTRTFSTTDVIYSTVVRPTTVYDVDTTTVFSTNYRTSTVRGPTRTVTSTERAASIRIPDAITVTVTSTSQVIEPCRTTAQTGYQYNTPAVAFNF